MIPLAVVPSLVLLFAVAIGSTASFYLLQPDQVWLILGINALGEKAGKPVLPAGLSLIERLVCSDGGAMTLRGALVLSDGRMQDKDYELDGRVCDCCQTDVAVSGLALLVVVVYVPLADDGTAWAVLLLGAVAATVGVT